MPQAAERECSHPHGVPCLNRLSANPSRIALLSEIFRRLQKEKNSSGSMSTGIMMVPSTSAVSRSHFNIKLSDEEVDALDGEGRAEYQHS
jgi:hypothetical protein